MLKEMFGCTVKNAKSLHESEFGHVLDFKHAFPWHLKKKLYLKEEEAD